MNKISGVVQASNRVWGILEGTDQGSCYTWSGEESERDFIFKSPRIGYEAIETLGMEILAGRSFSKDFNDDDSRVILIETALRMMGLEDPIGQRIRYSDDEEREILGVVADFHYGSIHHRVEPLIFRFHPRGRYSMMKIQAGAEETTLAQIERLYEKFDPEYPFEYTFLDDAYQALYEAESRMAVLSKYFSQLAIIISCPGIFGLAAFTAERRSKEIGIRKALGASVPGIVRLLSTVFTKMVLVAIAIALPVSYPISEKWLDGFAYKIDMA